ncbi:MAG: nucleotidyltransferase domain-containing protein [Dermatophilus congolensis]|nr:nucleotidyltransferase domain-containing protein [Dermatophilus congolensis]
MTLVAEYRAAQRGQEIARLRRILAVRAMLATGSSQARVADELRISQSAVSQQLRTARLPDVHPEVLVEAAAPILTEVAAQHGYSDLAVVGSVARRQARDDSDIDLLVRPAPGTSSFDFMRFKSLIENMLDRPVDLISYGGLIRGRDDDIRREAVLL